MSRDRFHTGSDTTTCRTPSSGKTDGLSPRQLADKRAFRNLVEAAGGLDAASMFCRLGKSQLQRCYDPNVTDTFAPIDVVADLEEITRASPGWPHVTRLHARENDLALVALPAAGGASNDSLVAALASASREHSDIAIGLLDALKGGDVTAAVAAELEREALESAEAAMRLAMLLRQRAGEP